MCGIAGILDSQTDLRKEKAMLEKMSETLKMRGPDSRGEMILQNAALIHRRLAVIDVENGAQPMSFRELTIVYNGELYNTSEIRKELKAKGMEFETTCDTEVVLKAYYVWREESVKRLNGIFAYAIWDNRKNELFAARDRIGVKPFFYSIKQNKFAFASRINTLLCLPWVDRKVTKEGFYEIFMLGPAKTPGKAIFKDISELERASYLKYSQEKGLSIQCYWRLEAKKHTENEAETVEHTHFLVRDAIERQLVSDVELATFLSGGLDSSIISKTASEVYKSRGETLTTYSVDYADNEKYFEKSAFQPNSDSEYTGLISEYIESNHKNIILSNTELALSLRDAASARCLPGFTDVDSSLLLFCREVKKNHTVCLSGECADEIFGGYPWYHRKEILFEDTFPWSRSTALRKSVLREGLLSDGDDYVRSAYDKTVRSAEFLESDSKTDRRMREMFMLNLDWFMQTLLVRKDAMSMESSLEVRVPFCDYRLVEYAYNMPWSIKALDGREKGVLRKAFENELPSVIAWRKKSPYPKTFSPDYLAEVVRMLRLALDDKNCILADIVNRKTVEGLIENPNSLSEPWYGQLMRGPQVLAYLLQFYFWCVENNVVFEGIV